MAEINFTPFPTLSTDRLMLRQLTIEDENEIFAIRSDERINKYLDRPLCKTIDEARKFIHKTNEGITRNESIYWAINIKTNSGLVGTICLWKISREYSKAEIGFELLPEHQGKGIMQEALPKIIEYGFKNMKLRTIVGEADPDNLKSIKLMEKFGFRYDRELNNTVVYSLLSDTERR